ncbi:sodium/potassium/calcium exchanger 1, partial [Striga asiatica]
MVHNLLTVPTADPQVQRTLLQLVQCLNPNTEHKFNYSFNRLKIQLPELDGEEPSGSRPNRPHQHRSSLRHKHQQNRPLIIRPAFAEREAPRHEVAPEHGLCQSQSTQQAVSSRGCTSGQSAHHELRAARVGHHPVSRELEVAFCGWDGEGRRDGDSEEDEGEGNDEDVLGQEDVDDASGELDGDVDEDGEDEDGEGEDVHHEVGGGRGGAEGGEGVGDGGGEEGGGAELGELVVGAGHGGVEVDGELDGHADEGEGGGVEGEEAGGEPELAVAEGVGGVGGHGEGTSGGGGGYVGADPGHRLVELGVVECADSRAAESAHGLVR